MRRKMSQVTESADVKLAASRSRLEQREAAAAAAQAVVAASWDHAHRWESVDNVLPQFPFPTELLFPTAVCRRWCTSDASRSWRMVLASCKQKAHHI